MIRIKIMAAILALAALLALTSCAGAGTMRSVSFCAMDTVMNVSVWDAANADGALAEARRTVEKLEGELSVTDPASAVARANAGDRVTLSERAAELCRRSLEMCEATNGALDITVYPLVRAWGFAAGETPDPAHRVPEQSEIDSLLSLVGFERVALADDGALTLVGGAQIDFGATAKGYAADLIAGTFVGRGIPAALIDLGGCVRTVGKKPDGSAWKIGVASPTGEGNACTVAVGETAVVTSGSYERYFEANGRRFVHIIDPKTGYPVEGDLLSVTVIGASAFECDALSTALFVLGYDGAVRYWRERGGIDKIDKFDKFEMILITADGVSATAGIAPSVECEGGAPNVIR